MGGLVFSEETLVNGNLFQFENRLKSHVNKYVEGGFILVTYFPQRENASTVDRGLQNVDELFGKRAPTRYDRINNFPLYQFGQANPENTEEQQIEDISVEGDALIAPATVVPKQFDFFIINHLKMTALFQVVSVQYDSMKVEGYYKIHYRLHSTSKETVDMLMKQVIDTHYTDLNSVGSDTNPIIKEDDFILRGKLEKMVNKMIQSYRALFYNARHNCFLYHDTETGLDYFDNCGNEFIAKYSLANFQNATNVIVLNSKLRDPQFAYRYNHSIYNWIELDCPERMLQRFFFELHYAATYQESSFHLWGEDEVRIMQPIPLQNAKLNMRNHFYFDDVQLNAFMDKDMEPTSSEFDNLIWKFIHKKDNLRIQDISLYMADTLLSSIKAWDVFLYVPIAIYIIRKVLRVN